MSINKKQLFFLSSQWAFLERPLRIWRIRQKTIFKPSIQFRHTRKRDIFVPFSKNITFNVDVFT